MIWSERSIWETAAFDRENKKKRKKIAIEENFKKIGICNNL